MCNMLKTDLNEWVTTLTPGRVLVLGIILYFLAVTSFNIFPLVYTVLFFLSDLSNLNSYHFLNSCLFHYSCPNFPPPPFPSSAQPTRPSHSQSPHCCPCPWVIHACSLTNPFHFFLPFPYPVSSGSCHSVPCFHVSGSVLFIKFLL